MIPSRISWKKYFLRTKFVVPIYVIYNGSAIHDNGNELRRLQLKKHIFNRTILSIDSFYVVIKNGENR